MMEMKSLWKIGLKSETEGGIKQEMEEWAGRDRDRERAQSRGGGKGGKNKDDGLTPEQRRERDAKALQEKAAKKAAQDAGGDSSGVAKVISLQNSIILVLFHKRSGAWGSIWCGAQADMSAIDSSLFKQWLKNAETKFSFCSWILETDAINIVRAVQACSPLPRG
ncbi:hypothetical protein L484_021619 [Morus notabilis]|uniref:Small EDRK-rich factor-like N-terminal domain-containing protein n=1 Tax=Morus notabilis TaxID=981085 RepID=W9RXY9_9ROSA|nr:hypothetical protein L484_021619 [Morus notabilis]